MPAPASHDQKLQVVPAMRVVKTQQQLMTTHACKSRCGERASAHCRTNAKTGPIQDPTGPIQEAARRLRGRRPRGLSKASRPARSGLRGRYPCSMHHCAKGSAKDLDVEARRSRRVRCRVVQGLATAANGIAKTRKGCEDACNVEASTPKIRAALMYSLSHAKTRTGCEDSSGSHAYEASVQCGGKHAQAINACQVSFCTLHDPSAQTCLHNMHEHKHYPRGGSAGTTSKR